MSNQVANGRYPTEGSVALLTELLAAAILTGAKVHLYKSSFVPVAASVAADFLAAECDFTGYAAQTLTYSGVGLDAADTPTALSDRAFFQATDGAAPNTVGGVFITHDTAGPTTHTAVEWFPLLPTVPMAAALAFIGIVVAFQMPAAPGYVIADY